MCVRKTAKTGTYEIKKTRKISPNLTLVLFNLRETMKGLLIKGIKRAIISY